MLAFHRFASSGSEDSDEEEEETESQLSSLKQNTLQSMQLLPQSDHSTALQSSKTQAKSTESSVSLVVLNITVNDDQEDSMSTIVPVSTASQDNVSVLQIKLDAIRQMQADLHRSVNSTCERLQRLLVHEADRFILYLEDEKQWLHDEQQSIGHYILGCTSRKIHLELVPISRMPQPTIDLAIVGTKKKISDLSQRPYTCYVIDIIFNGTTWQLARRYNDFNDLHSHLKRKHPDIELPGLPSKHVFTPVEGALVNHRKEQLEVFLKQLLLHPIASTDVLLMSFLGVVSVSRDPELGLSDKRVIHVTSLHDSVTCGDVVLFSCRFGASRLQRKFTGSKYDHIGIVVPGESRFLLQIMEATSEGIQVHNLKTRLMAYAREVSNSIVLRKVKTERTPELIALLEKFIRHVEGNPYSILGILHFTGESDRNMLNNSVSGARAGCEEANDIVSDFGSSVSSTPSPMTEGVDLSKPQDAKRKYFCSSLVASAWKELGWLQTKRKSTSFWPGSFEDGGEVEKLLAPGVVLAPEAVIDCRIIEVGLSVQC
ncbi:hypothetical protein KXD40_003351 [Peronospora effusa]|uniref:PX domain-containing protein n=1 Tax=Peronospora effusa TaxID=542832 RepID=A0A3M6VE61_9STRA|nr:hypothetical protein DD238_007386 [Peronospora effusa]RQM13225.1 hypothetical protein DD237_007769 [Peronospora effusa]UIZ29366.1 hypothetical protein KXD40_003351 [Peronospora effusa]CAI5702473.1 unnamed protein product [Peronospora effusa]